MKKCKNIICSIAVIVMVAFALTLPLAVNKYEKAILQLKTEIAVKDAVIANKNAVIDSLIIDSYKPTAFEYYKIKEDTNVKKMD